MFEASNDTAIAVQAVPPPSASPFHVQELTRHSLPTLSLAHPSMPAVQDRQLLWFAIWMVWGALSTVLFHWDGETHRVILLTLTGMILGVVGGMIGDQMVEKRSGRDLIVFWAAFWAIFWVFVFWTAMTFNWTFARLHGDRVPGFGRIVILGTIGSAWVGANGGALGGLFRTWRRKWRH
jgi:hypothetical protein